MARRLWPLGAAAAAAGVGLLLLVVGLLVATVGAAPETETLTVRAASPASAVVTAPGVLELRADKVQVRAADPDGRRVVLAVARTADAEAYLATSPHLLVTGRTGSGQPRQESVGTAGEALPDPATVDIWAASSSGAGSAELTWSARPGRWTLIAMAVGSPGAAVVAAPEQVDLTWHPRESTSPAVALIAIGLLLLVAGGVAMAIMVLQRRDPMTGEDEDDDASTAAPTPRVVEHAAVPTGPLTMELPVVPAGAVPSSRRAAREAERSAGRRAAAPTPSAPPPQPAPSGPQAAPAQPPAPPAVVGDAFVPDADPPTSVLSLGRHRTADLFGAEPRPGRRPAPATATPGESGDPAESGQAAQVGEPAPSVEGPARPAPSRAFRFPRTDSEEADR